MRISPYVRALSFGIIAGMRSMSAPAFTNTYLVSRNKKNVASFPLDLLRSKHLTNLFKIAAIGELFADKLPFIPARISPGALVARMASGTWCGAAVCKFEDKSVRVGAVTGGIAALASAYLFYFIRKLLSNRTKLPDALTGAGEDALVIMGGLKIVQKNRV